MDLLKLIQARQTDRVAFDPERGVEKADLWKILEASRWAPTPHNMQNFEVVIVDDKPVLESLSNIRRPPVGGDVQERLRNVDAYASSEEDLLKRKIGILVINPEGTRISGERAPLEGPVVGVVTFNPGKKPPNVDGEFLSILGLGCVMENMCLMAHSLGLGIQIQSRFTGGAEEEVKKILNIPAEMRVAFGFRVGYTVAKPSKYLRVRRDIGDFTYHNRFGKRYYNKNSEIP
ncbi:MAG: nitroreductase family protein [Candidatus Bathyarchaeota archaeon]